jgi:predicted nucleic acid-binding protein
MKKNRIFVDTSVFGGVFDIEFSGISRRFFDEVREGKHIVLLSETTSRELVRAPIYIQQFYADLPANYIEKIDTNREIVDLTDAYLAAKVVSKRWIDDASQVATATVARADALVSWNFKHMVKWEKIRGFNAVNLKLGYPIMTIFTPREVISDEKGL